MISVVICTYNCADLLPRALDSALAQEGLGEQGFEVLVVDDGSTDHTPELVGRYAAKDARVRPVRQDHGGLPAACNRGLERASGAFFLRLDADDELLPGALARLLGALEARPEATFAIADHVEVPPAGEAPIARRVGLECLFETIAPGVLFRTDQVRRVGGYRDVFWEEYDLYLRLLPLGPAIHVEGLLYRYRRRAESMTGSEAARREGWRQLLRLWRLGELRLLGCCPELERVAAEQRLRRVSVSPPAGEPDLPAAEAEGPRHLGRRQVKALFEGRRVCVVGSARGLRQHRQGQEIDGHDLVVRLNDFEVGGALTADLGRRTDVVVINSGMAATLPVADIVDRLAASGAGVLLAKKGGRELFWRLRRAAVRQPIRVGSLPRASAFETFGGRTLTTGSLAVACLLQGTELASLYATGFDFYTGERSYYYNDRRVIDTNHDMDHEMGYWRQLLLPDARLRVDARLAAALEAPARGPRPGIGLPPLPLEAAGESFEVLDLRALEDPELELKCNASHWLVALGDRCPDARLWLEVDGEVLHLALPRHLRLRLRLAGPSTRVANPDGLPLERQEGGAVLEIRGGCSASCEAVLSLGPRLLVLLAC